MTYANSEEHQNLNPADAVVLDEFAQGDISSREAVRRVIDRMGAPLPATLSESADGDGTRRRPQQMSENTQAFARGDLDVAGWLANAESRYRRS